MTGRVIPLLRVVGDDRHGTVHVLRLEGGGYEVGHESSLGNSWGNFRGPYDDPQEAIAAAFAMNRDEYGGRCAVSIAAALPADGGPDAA